MNLKETLSNLTVAEKIQVMEQLWVSLSAGSKLSSPEWHKQIIQSRRSKLSTGDAQTMELPEMKERVAKKL